MDVFSPQKRSEVMSRIRGRDTKSKLKTEGAREWLEKKIPRLLGA